MWTTRPTLHSPFGGINGAESCWKLDDSSKENVEVNVTTQHRCTQTNSIIDHRYHGPTKAKEQQQQKTNECI